MSFQESINNSKTGDKRPIAATLQAFNSPQETVDVVNHCRQGG